MIRPMTESDIEEVLPYVRQQEATTISRLALDPEALLRKALGPFAFVGVAEDRVACLFGIAFDPGIGSFPRLWLVTTSVIERHKIEFLRENRRFVYWAHSQFGTLEGCVDVGNLISRRWMKWLGFHEAGEAAPGYVRMFYGY